MGWKERGREGERERARESKRKKKGKNTAALYVNSLFPLRSPYYVWQNKTLFLPQHTTMLAPDSFSAVIFCTLGKCLDSHLEEITSLRNTHIMVLI